MGTCRCEVLNVLSGDVARDYLRTHLQHLRVDGMGRNVHSCPDSDILWTEETEQTGYAENALVLRRTPG
jgi:hypothetical protein